MLTFQYVRNMPYFPMQTVQETVNNYPLTGVIVFFLVSYVLTCQ
jgi:hypothetical protein